MSCVIERTTDSINFEYMLQANLETVWKTLIDPDKIKQWFCSNGYEGVIEPGKDAVLRFHDDNQSRIQTVSLIPLKEWSFRWVPAECSIDPITVESATTLVTIQLTPEGDRTKLTLTESGFSKFAPNNMRWNLDGWDMCLADLQKSFEDGIHDAMHFQRFLKAPIEKVYRALTDPEQMVKAFGMDKFEGKVEVGQIGVWTFQGKQTHLEWVALEAPNKVVYRWVPGEFWTKPIPDNATLVTIQLFPFNDGTLLLLREEGFRAFGEAAFQMNYEGWGVEVLPLLQKFVEGE
ncbi:MAG: SRPBCC domain-containing protein [Armatimonadetes bacterium]|nr:SRPBCC domain-containing protein [Armatimonadota bacterium]